MPIYAGVFFISISVLGAEMGIIRMMSVINSSSFASMVISIALLGFGISGTAITLMRRYIEPRIDSALFAAALATMFFLSVTFPLAGTVEFIPQSIHEDKTQLLCIGAYYLFFSSRFLQGHFL